MMLSQLIADLQAYMDAEGDQYVYASDGFGPLGIDSIGPVSVNHRHAVIGVHALTPRNGYRDEWERHCAVVNEPTCDPKLS